MHLKNQIILTLKEIPASRNSDVTLMIEIWKRFYSSYIKVNSDQKLGIFLDSLCDLPREDAIKRIRAIIQNEEGLYLPTEEKIRKQRRINQEKWLNWIRTNNEYRRI